MFHHPVELQLISYALPQLVCFHLYYEYIILCVPWMDVWVDARTNALLYLWSPAQYVLYFVCLFIVDGEPWCSFG